jgi:hypothetical protein
MRHFAIPILAGLLAAAAAHGEWKSARPITYAIDYQAGHVANQAFLKTISEAPPQLLHVGEDIPFSSVYGTKEGYAGDQFKLLAPAEIRSKIAEVTAYVDALHRAGVRWVIPYINNKAVFGDHVKRTGLWQVFDHWEQYVAFGFGPKPPGDLVEAQMQYPFRTIRISKPDQPYYPRKLYQMCVNHPTWRRYLLAVTANLARCGYDGTFVDEMDLHDYCPYDERQFRDYVAARYDAPQRLRRYGFADLGQVRLGYAGDGALWHDTQAFWAESNTGLLEAVRDEGRKYRPDFFVIPNYGPYSHFDGLNRRIASGKDPEPWARASRMIMFEEWHRPGQLGPEAFLDYRLQYKVAFALGFRAGLLSYLAQEPVGIELAMAEAASGGGGALIQPYYRSPESRRKYGRFFNEHADLWEGYDTMADVAVLYSYEQLYWGNTAHVQDIYRLSGYLSNRHVTFDLLRPADASAARLARYKAVITPSLKYLSGSALEGLAGHVRAGGVWIDIGGSGRFDDSGRLRPEPARRRPSAGFGTLNELVPYPRFAHYLLSEDQNNSSEETRAIFEATLAGEVPARAAQPKRDLRELLEEATGRKLAVIAGNGRSGLRANLWRKNVPGGERIVVHLVNYNCPLPTKVRMGKDEFQVDGPLESYAPRAVEAVAVRLPVPASRVTSLRAWDPDMAGSTSIQRLKATGDLEFVIDSVRIYKVVAIDLRPGGSPR